MNKLLTPKDVQEIIGLSKTSIYKLISLKGFPKIRIGKRYFVEEEKLKEYLSEHSKSTIYLG